MAMPPPPWPSPIDGRLVIVDAVGQAYRFDALVEGWAWNHIPAGHILGDGPSPEDLARIDRAQRKRARKGERRLATWQGRR